MACKRSVVRVQWKKTTNTWTILVDGQFFNSRWYKGEAVKDGRGICKRKWLNYGQPAQLVVHNKNGRIGFENTYGRDPRRFKG